MDELIEILLQYYKLVRDFNFNPNEFDYNNVIKVIQSLGIEDSNEQKKE